MKLLKDLGELELVRQFSKTYIPGKDTVVGIGDDCSVIDLGVRGEYLLFTCDAIVEDVHFRRKEASGFKIGWKAICAGVSDIAAMGGIPVSAVVTLALPASLSAVYTEDITKGLQAAAKKCDIDISGGDTVGSPESIMISVAVVGKVKKKGMVLRNGACPGDKILVTGALGGSIIKKQFEFVPRIREAHWLVSNFRINSMMDITDGLSLDLARINSASGVGAVLYEECIPVSKDAKKCANSLMHALNDGEDYELLFTTKDADKIVKNWIFSDVQISVIGEITEKQGKIFMVDKNKKVRNIIPKGYEHFK